MALAGAMIAGACSTSEPTTLVTEPDRVAADGATQDDTSTEFDPVDAVAATETPAVVPTPGTAPTTTPGPLITPTPVPSPVAPRPVSSCPGTEVPRGLLFVWGVADDDPDGGLVAHTDADVDAPITRVLAPNALAIRPTGNCKPAPNGAPWFELFDAATDRFDWVNARYLAPAAPACLHGESNGSPTRAGALDPRGSDTQLFGPIPGFALAEDDVVAFLPDTSELDGQVAPLDAFRWYRPESVTIDVPCFLNGTPGPRCLSATVQLFSFTDPEFRVNGDTPIDVVRTGRLYSHPDQRGLREEFIEVTIEGDPGRYWYDPAVTRATSARCPADGSSPVSEIDDTAFEALECTVDWGGADFDSFSIGSDDGIVDHVHAIRSLTDEGSGCARLVFEFGTGLWTDGERPTNSLPAMVPTYGQTSTSVRIDACAATADPTCVFGTTGRGDIEIPDYGVRAFVARGADGQISIEVLHPTADANVQFLENPGRLVIDIRPEPGATAEWYGGAPVLPERLPTNIVEGEPLIIRGWDRPFEAQGQWRVYRVDDLISFEPDTPLKLDNYAESDLDLVASGLYMTADWTQAWGAFVAEFPELEPGIYALLVGSSSPKDGAYVAAGQVVRIHAADVDPATLPELPPQWWAGLALSN